MPYVISGKQVFISGQVTMDNGALKYVGIVGKEISLDDAKAAARLCAINLLAQLKAAAGGDLDKVARCVKLGVFVNCVPGFDKQPEVANGASDPHRRSAGRARASMRAPRWARAHCSRQRRRGSGRGVRAGVTQDKIIARIAGAASEIGAAAWNACANPDGADDPHPFTRYEFFAACEESGSATARSRMRRPLPSGNRKLTGAITGLLPMYLKSHSQGEYVFDHGWADAFQRAGGEYYPKLQASVPFTPVTGRRLLIAANAPQEETRNALLAAGASAVEQLDASSPQCITFMTEGEWKQAGALGYLQRNDQQFHWENAGYNSFDDFLAALSFLQSGKNLRKERAAVAAEGVSFDWLSGRDITEKAHWDTFFEFYMDTGGRKWGRPYLTREFFSRLGDTMGEQVVLILAKRAGHYIAGALNLREGKAFLFGRNWGCTGEHSIPCISRPAIIRRSTTRSRTNFPASKPARRANTNCCAATCRSRPIRRITIAHPGLRRAVGDSPSPRNAKPWPEQIEEPGRAWAVSEKA